MAEMQTTDELFPTPAGAPAWPALSAPGPVSAPASAAASGPAGRLYMTSELRAATGLSRTHMDFYLREGIIQPTARTESGYLLFAASELDALRDVLRWRQAGLGIREIRERLGRERA